MFTEIRAQDNSTYCSNVNNIIIGDPHGTDLGPFLFIIYINKLTAITDQGQFISFADDITFYYSDYNNSTLEISSYIQISNILDWLDKNGL